MVDDIGLEPMTFRTSKEAPSEAQTLEGTYMLFFGDCSINRVDPIDTTLSYWCRKNALIMSRSSQEYAESLEQVYSKSSNPLRSTADGGGEGVSGKIGCQTVSIGAV